MVLINILAKDENHVSEIADFLVENKLVVNSVELKNTMVRKKQDNGVFKNEAHTLISAKTKALLVHTIESKLRDKYKSNMPVMYSIPIVSMNWELTDELLKETAKV